jgi:hypothetical protein
MVGKKQEANNEEVYKLLGERIKDLRKEADYTNAGHFAYEHGFTASQYGEYEVGKDMRLSTLIRIAKIHNITVSDLLKDIV